MFSDYYPPHIGGGVERVVHELSRGLAAKGADVRLFTLNTSDAPDREVMDGVEVFRAPAVELTRRIGVQSAVSPQLFSLALAELRRKPPDLLHAHSRFFFSTVVATSLSLALRLPLVTTLHVGAMDTIAKAYRYPVLAYEQTVGRAVVRRSQRIVAVSEAVAAHAARLGAAPDKVRVIPNAVDSLSFHVAPEATDGGLRVVFVGRLIDNKGPQFLVEAAPAIFAQHPEAEIVFAGEGPLEAALKARAHELGIDGRVRFLGVCDDVAGLLSRCHVFVRPSLTEGMPLTVLEAMACALPVVATAVGGTPEVVEDGVTGILVRPRDVGGLAHALNRLLGDADLRTRLGRNGRELVEKTYTWERVVERNLEVYGEVARTPAPAARRAAAAA
jgi:glycosyltransferase involved in cell wall biosynthesis